jgi:hypothetical protein
MRRNTQNDGTGIRRKDMGTRVSKKLKVSFSEGKQKDLGETGEENPINKWTYCTQLFSIDNKNKEFQVTQNKSGLRRTQWNKTKTRCNAI